ncbi:MAG TPA: hydrogenase formation protein HypD [Phycisphaerae bacterium]|nr:hydrogenase formation protein HypD [Phycisphaerae bacterium]
MNTAAPQLVSRLRELCRGREPRIQLMEVCGTHTVAIFRTGLRGLLPPELRLVSGPGCPVCVTAQRHIDAAIELAARPGVILATYGDMLRVPGRRGSLERLRAEGATIHVVNSARTALDLAREHADRQVVFLGVGFETTAPATAATVLEADREGIKNFCVLMCHKLVVPAMRALLNAGDVPLDGFLAPGHVSVIIGAAAYAPIVAEHHRPVVIAGFEPDQILRGLVALVRQVCEARAAIENVYSAVVTDAGNCVALDLLAKVCVPADTAWRELGTIPQSGLELAPPYRRFDALERFGVQLGADENHPLCRCGEVITGKAEPADCPAFADACTPLSPIGPCMVSSEGTCAAWYKYNRAAVQTGRHG